MVVIQEELDGWGHYIKIQDCYNSGTIKGSKATGGIMDWIGKGATADGSIINSYNVGAIQSTSTNEGGVLGCYDGDPTLTNCYNLNTSSTYAVGGSSGSGSWGVLGNDWAGHIEVKNATDMKNLSSALGENWTEDRNDINQGYPILKWQASE